MASCEMMVGRLCLACRGRVPHFCSEMSPHSHIGFTATRMRSLPFFSALLNAGSAAGTIPTIFLTICILRRTNIQQHYTGDLILCKIVILFLYTLHYLKHILVGLSHSVLFLCVDSAIPVFLQV